ncbi:VOC family protein [Paraburkholderia sp. D15]|uniref:VOC family protein n=1 Tax=Paraburkholderia sp. D15 TaxID=2880218 RepID=UPI002479835E|nr:VOC family protein [Paraburkholderia sp. D15]WGS54215.1 VOC family protein [Paraburkholderia sp. D15]
MSNQTASPDVVSLRSFLPARDFETSLRFYTDLGFVASRISGQIASMQLGPFAFLLQEFDSQEFANNYMMHLMVRDLDAWWARIDALDLAGRYGVQAPRAPKLEPWGLRVAYVFDPSGVLWHIAQDSH